jgi:tRNA A58 N-methylase Trm61
VQEGDRVLIDGVRLSPKLLKDESFNYQHGLINNNEIIGKSVLAPLYVRSVSGKAYKIELPSLEEYVTGTPRLVTPVRTGRIKSNDLRRC